MTSVRRPPLSIDILFMRGREGVGPDVTDGDLSRALAWAPSRRSLCLMEGGSVSNESYGRVEGRVEGREEGREEGKPAFISGIAF